MSEKNDMFSKREVKIINYLTDEAAQLVRNERHKSRRIGAVVGFVGGVVMTAAFVAGLNYSSKKTD